MSVKEKFDRRFGTSVESFPSDVLEAVDFLINASTELEDSNELLRKRISALENENNILRAFYSDIEFSESDIENMKNAIDEVTNVVELTDKLKNALTTSASVFSEIAAFNADVADKKKECDVLLSQNRSSAVDAYESADGDEIYEEDDEGPSVADVYDDEPDDSIVDLTDDDNIFDEPLGEDSEPEHVDYIESVENIEETPDVTTEEISSDIVDEDIAEKLKNMLRDSMGEQADDISDSSDDIPDEDEDDKDDTADDISALILKMMKEADEDIPKENNEPADSEPLEEPSPKIKEISQEPQIKSEEKSAPHDLYDKAEHDINIDIDAEDIEIEDRGRSFFSNAKKHSNPTDVQGAVNVAESKPMPTPKAEEPKTVANVDITPPEKKEKEDIKSIKDSLARIKNKRRGN